MRITNQCIFISGIFSVLHIKMQRMKKTKTAKISRYDLPESENDKKHLQPDEGTLDLPEVKDIPGQEHVRPLPAGEMADTTISSADEEGPEELNEESDTDISRDTTNVTRTEKDLLEMSSESMSTPDDVKLRQSLVDNTDEDGTPLNEQADVSGSDLDVPGSEEDDENEEIGEEDEENNPFSLNDEKEDQNQGRN
jgi:hypothetical protein